MSVTLIKTGPQATLQGRPRSRLRHMGVPWSGAADPLSLTLANRLVGNDAHETAIEITFGGFACRTGSRVSMAVTGAPAKVALNGARAPLHQTLYLAPGDRLDIGQAEAGARLYLAIAGGLDADEQLASPSTYLPAGLGGHHGRALRPGDVLALKAPREADRLQTPAELRLQFSHGWALRATPGGEHDTLAPNMRTRFWLANYTASPQSDRMGVRLVGPRLSTASEGQMKSAPVFPGTVQCPEDGQPILLGADAQTTGGYPRIAQVARCDRHLIGQIRPGDHVRFLRRTPEDAAQDLVLKSALFENWLGVALP